MTRWPTRALRELAARTLSLARVTAPARIAREKLTVVTFHRVLPETLAREYPYPVLSITPEVLDFCLEHFARHYDAGPLTAQYRRLLEGGGDRPLLALTFDDGQLDNLEHGAPVLRRHGLAATFYLPAALLEERRPAWHDELGFALLRGFESDDRTRGALTTLFGIDPATAPSASEWATWVSLDVKRLAPDDRAARISEAQRLTGSGSVPGWSLPMSWEGAAALAREGHELGSHSMTHALLHQLGDEALRWEVAESRRLIEARTGADVVSFCYPNGDHDARIVAATRAAGYSNGVIGGAGANARGADALRLARFDLVGRQVLGALGGPSKETVDWLLSGLFPE